ncbi:hypothetical protein thsps21_07340 [Pseudomonas sp. No.21]|nr:hypothetical protein TUM20249_03560 [Pseudomonas tohonis]
MEEAPEGKEKRAQFSATRAAMLHAARQPCATPGSEAQKAVGGGTQNHLTQQTPTGSAQAQSPTRARAQTWLRPLRLAS